MPMVNTDHDARDLEMEEEEEDQFPNSFRFCCYREMELLEFREKLVFRSQDCHDSSTTRPSFSISRSDGAIESCSGDFESGTATKCSIIYGIVGIIRLLSGTYVLVITSREEVSNHLGFPIFLVKSMEFLSCNSAIVNSTKQVNSDEAYFMTLLKIIETTPALYYSYEIDLTLNLQRSWEHAKQRATRPLWKQADPRFIWNRNLLEELIEYKLDPFIVPLIQGSVRSMQVMLKNSPLKISLISRRCNRRLGTRMWRRGANLDGDTANFIETEQLVEFEDFRTAFLQVRGSIPLLWEQIVDLSYKPQLNILNHEETPKVIERHLNDLKQRYGEVVAVDLTDNHGEEGQLSRRFALEMKKVLNVRYISFDFHQFCSNANLDNLQPLCDKISEDIKMHGYFMLNLKRDILFEQKGVIRTNCIDCLDRTNVTQCYLGRKSLDAQLQEMGVFSSSDYISMYPEINEDFKILWIDHGDDISLGYSGTHALKRDFVRYGRQTLSGFIKDGLSAISRYYLNNFQDGIRQDALDLISGHYCIDRGAPSPFHLNELGSFSYLPTPTAVIVGGLTLTTLTINQSAGTARHFFSSMLWAGLAAGVIAWVNANGRQLCSRPRLCNLL